MRVRGYQGFWGRAMRLRGLCLFAAQRGAARHDCRLGASAPARAFRVWLRCLPVSGYSSSRIRPFSAFLGRPYQDAVAFVTAHRWLNLDPPCGLVC